MQFFSHTEVLEEAVMQSAVLSALFRGLHRVGVLDEATIAVILDDAAADLERAKHAIGWGRGSGPDPYRAKRELGQIGAHFLQHRRDEYAHQPPPEE